MEQGEKALQMSTPQLGERALSLVAVAGLAGLVLLAIVILFVLAMYIDCRQQRLQDMNKAENRRLRLQIRALQKRRIDEIDIASSMEHPELTPAPADILQNIV